MVRLGEWDADKEIDCIDNFCAPSPKDFSIAKHIVHNKYNKASKNAFHDILLLQLGKRVEFSEFIKPICLPLETSVMVKDLAGHSLDAAGWGIWESGNSSSKKLKVSLKFFPTSNCSNIYERNERSIKSHQVIIVSISTYPNLIL